MAAGILSRDRALGSLLQGIIDRIAKLERPKTIHVGPNTTGPKPGYTLSVDPGTGELIVTSDNGTVTVIGAP